MNANGFMLTEPADEKRPGQDSMIQANWAKIAKIGAVLSVAALMSACSTTSQSGARPIAYSFSAAPHDIYTDALDGGLISQVQNITLSATDKHSALEAEYKALEVAPGGQAVKWTGEGGVTGEVVAATPYQVGSQNCRQYTETVTQNGSVPVVVRGAACRNASNGTWTPLS